MKCLRVKMRESHQNGPVWHILENDSENYIKDISYLLDPKFQGVGS